MTKLSMTYEFDTIEDAQEIQRHLDDKNKYLNALKDYTNWLRNEIKYACVTELEPAQVKFFQIMNDYEIDIY